MRTSLTNLTPHTINVEDVDGSYVHELPSAGMLRTETFSDFEGAIEVGDDGERVAISLHRFGAPDSTLPPEIADHYYVVSLAAAQSIRDHFPARRDFLFPGEIIRDTAGRPVACKGLSRLA